MTSTRRERHLSRARRRLQQEIELVDSSLTLLGRRCRVAEGNRDARESTCLRRCPRVITVVFVLHPCRSIVLDAVR